MITEIIDHLIENSVHIFENMLVTCDRTLTTTLDAPVVTFTRLKMLSLQDLNVSQHIRGFYVELRYESSTPTSKELSSSIFQSLSVSQ